MLRNIDRYKQVVLSAFVIIYLGMGLLTFRDFGMSYDEQEQRHYGNAVWSYVAKGDKSLLDNRVKYHGPFFEIVLIGAEKIIRLKDTRLIYQMRHLVNFMFFTLGLVFFYLLANLYFRDWKLAFIGMLLMALTPRIVGQAFYNTKDIPFMVMFIIGLYTHMQFIRTRTWSWAIIHGMVCGIAIDVRILGGLLVFFTLLHSLIEAGVYQFSWKKHKLWYLKVMVFLIVAGFSTIAFWPILWEGPVHHFHEALREMSRFPWGGSNLFLGKFMKGTEVPWYYTLLWMGITLPVSYLLGFCLGLFATVASIQKQIHKPSAQLYLDLLWPVSFFLPLVIYCVLHSTLYGDWRHSYYLYPAFIMIVLNGIKWLFEIQMWQEFRRKRQWMRWGMVSLLIFVCVSNVYWISRYHPYQYMFFNAVIGGIQGAKFKFQIDYWGAPYLQALEYILENDDSEKIRIAAPHSIGRFSQDMIKVRDRQRLVFVRRKDVNQADYFIGNYRFVTQEYHYLDEFYSIYIGKTKIMAVFKLTRNLFPNE